MRPELEVPRAAGAEPAGPVPDGVVVVSRAADEPGKLKGIDPSWVPALARAFDLVLVEADGSRQLPMKAPAPHEPALPPGADLVVGVVGLDGLGRPMDQRTVHRPERFASVTGCAPGAPIRWEHLAALVRHPDGLFKAVTGRRALLLNKADVAVCLPSASQLRELAADLVLLTALADPSRPACRSDGEEPGCP